MKVAVVTAMEGDYDDVLPPSYQDEDFDYFFFTDVDKTLEGYTSVKFKSNYPRFDKDVKIRTHLHLKGYDAFIWHDANMHQVSSLKPLLASVNKPMGFLNHPSRKCVTEEIEAIAYFKKANVEDVCAEVQEYLSEGMPIGFGLWECGVNVKYNTPEVNNFCEQWYYNLGKAKRDQLSFAYTLWKTGMEVNWLHTCTYRGREFQMTSHRKPLTLPFKNP